MEAKFRVPAEMPGGVYRDGVGLLEPGAEFTIPDAASPIDDDGEFIEDELKAPHHLLVPLNEDADELLQRTYGGQVPLYNLKGEPVFDKDGNQRTQVDPRLKLCKRFGAAPKVESPKLAAKRRKAEAEAKRLEKELEEKANAERGAPQA